MIIALIMEAVSTSETLINFYLTAWRNIPEDSRLHTPKPLNAGTTTRRHNPDHHEYIQHHTRRNPDHHAYIHRRKDLRSHTANQLHDVDVDCGLMEYDAV
jgi:hypothetical protein